MEAWEFVDLATKAKELSITEATLRARALSGSAVCFIYASRLEACAEEDCWLPAHDPEQFPMVEWEDFGSTFRSDDPFKFQEAERDWPPNRRPHYQITGWVAVHPDIVGTILTRGEAQPYRPEVAVFDCDLRMVCPLEARLMPREEWVPVDTGEYRDGGYWREIPPSLTVAHLFMPAASSTAQKPLSSRKEQSYLGIVAAMRALLRDKDGGGFPSDAKIIDQLVERYKSLDGISKRNLEGVFADATRTAGDLVPPK